MKFRSETTLYFIRHGQTPSNAAKIKQGVKIDEYLDTQGILEVEAMAKLIKFLDLDMLFTSYLHRAEETAAIVYRSLGASIPVLHDFRLREKDFGSLSGKSDEELNSVIPGRLEKEHMQAYDYRPFGGESVDDVRLRVISAIMDIIQNYNHKNIGIVTHGGVMRLLLFHFPEIPRIYHASQDEMKGIANADIYEWTVSESKIQNLKSLLETKAP